MAPQWLTVNRSLPNKVILDSWEPNDRILVNLLRALPDGSLAARVPPGSPTAVKAVIHRLERLSFPGRSGKSAIGVSFQVTCSTLGTRNNHSNAPIRATIPVMKKASRELPLR